MFKPHEHQILARITLLLLSMGWMCWMFYTKHPHYGFFLVPVVVYLLYTIFQSQRRVYTELEEFTQAIRYRDFSRHFNVQQAPTELQPLRTAFNQVSDSFKQVSKEKETHYQYLQQILEMVDTGIIAFELSQGEVIWMNNSVKNILNLPQLKNIYALKSRNKALLNEMLAMPLGENKLVTLSVARNTVKLLITAAAFQTNGQKFKLVTFQNISETLEENEADAWSRLLRVMTHELMNSIAPISSLASTLDTLVEDAIQNEALAPTYQEDLKIGIKTIQKRSDALLKFAETYRNLNKITSLTLKQVRVMDLFQSQCDLMAPTLTQRGIELEIILKDPDLKIEIDASLLEQVLINLIVNAIEAVKEKNQPKIVLSAELDTHKKCMIKVNDNGSGIAPDAMDKIFIPFFSTKRNGSGIGLNVCKQIMLLHKGNINVQTIENVGTSFVLTF